MIRRGVSTAPMPPVEMSACSAAKSGHILQPSLVHAWHSLRGTSWYESSFIQICSRPLMFIFLMSARARPYLASRSSSKIASSNVFEHSRPMLRLRRRATLPTLRWRMMAGDEDWQLTPTRTMSFEIPETSSGARTGPKRYSSASDSHDRKRGQARVQVVQPFCPWEQSFGPNPSSVWKGL